MQILNICKITLTSTKSCCVILGNFLTLGLSVFQSENGHNDSCPDILIDSKGQYIFERRNITIINSVQTATTQCLQDQTSNGNK